MATKRKTSKRTSKIKNTKKDAFVSPLYEYITQITPEEKYKFYEEAYKIYMDRLEKADLERFRFVRDTEENLLKKKGHFTVLYIFQRVVPTLCDNEPIYFLRDAIQEAENCDFDSLCVFLQIAGFRWSIIEKSYWKSLGKSRKGREYNKWWNKKEYKYLRPLFEEKHGVIKEEYREKFINGYRKVLVPWLIENWEKLEDILKAIKKEKTDYKNEINEIIDDYINDKNSVVEKSIKKSKGIQEYYRNRYDELVEYQNEEKVFFDSANQAFCLSELTETIWKKLPPWNIKWCKQDYTTFSTVVLNKIEEQEILTLLKDDLSIRDNTANENKKTPLPKAMIVEKKDSTESLDDGIIPLTPAEIARFYDEAYLLYTRLLNTEKKQPSKANWIAAIYNLFDNLPFGRLEMALYVFQKVVPTFCDDIPFRLLGKAIEHTCWHSDNSWMCLFMQISSFRWARIEESCVTKPGSRQGNIGKKSKWLHSKEGILLSPVFEEMRKESNGIYDVDYFNRKYKELILPTLIEDWPSLLEKIERELNKNSKYEEKVSQIKDAYRSGDLKQVVVLIDGIYTLKRGYRDKYSSVCNNKNDNAVYFRSINRFFLMSELRKSLWTELEPWVVTQEDLISDALNMYKFILCLMNESITLSKSNHSQ